MDIFKARLAIIKLDNKQTHISMGYELELLFYRKKIAYKKNCDKLN